jgi:hypothetical protein
MFTKFVKCFRLVSGIRIVMFTKFVKCFRLVS